MYSCYSTKNAHQGEDPNSPIMHYCTRSDETGKWSNPIPDEGYIIRSQLMQHINPNNLAVATSACLRLSSQPLDVHSGALGCDVSKVGSRDILNQSGSLDPARLTARVCWLSDAGLLANPGGRLGHPRWRPDIRETSYGKEQLLHIPKHPSTINGGKGS